MARHLRFRPSFEETPLISSALRPTSVEPVSLLLAVAAAAGFVWRAINAAPANVDRHDGDELGCRPPTVTSSKKGRLAEFHPSAIDVLPEYEVVRDLVEDGFPVIFVTGSAGTGKSTFIRWMQHKFDGAVLVGAPTGMAALNVDGQTLHKLCSLPPAWIRKADIKFNSRRPEVRHAKVLIIDEVTMVTANLLDAVSAYFKKNRSDDRPFGGLSVVMVGDLFQLPPVVSKDVRELFVRNYGSAKFFNARSIQSSTYYAVQLTKAFRQSDQHFVDLLAKIRVGRDLPSAVAELNTLCRTTSVIDEGAVYVSPRIVDVDRINSQRLAGLPGPDFVYRGTIDGTFKRKPLPSPETLCLRVGAQVMFTKNARREGWINGSVGTVRALHDDKVVVEIEGGRRVTVTAESWDDFEYGWDPGEKEISRRVVGQYKQLPLMLGWAITIHKSQGKTLERVHIDFGAGAFETGQAYVALSRCRSPSAVTLSRSLSISDVMVDEESRAFNGRLLSIIENLPPAVMRERIKEARQTQEA